MAIVVFVDNSEELSRTTACKRIYSQTASESHPLPAAVTMIPTGLPT